MRARILHFTDRGDTSGFFPQLAKWHDRDRYEMRFATLAPIDASLRTSMEEHSIPVVSLDCRARVTYPSATIRLAQLLRKERIDAIHTHLFEPSLVGLTAALVARTNVRVMTRHYSDYHTRIFKTWHVRLDRVACGLADCIIAVSRHTREHLLTVESVPDHKVRVVLNGIDFERVRVSSPDAPAALRSDLAGGCQHVILVAGRLHPEKGYRDLFEALPEVSRRVGGSLRLLVAGVGSFREEFERQVRQLGIEEMVSFLGFRRDLPDVMVASDLVVLPSVAEAFGLVLAEALYLKVPVVSTRVGGIPEVVEDGVTGLLVPPNDSRALAQALVRLLSDPALRLRLATNGHDRVREEFAFERMVRQYEEVYEALLRRA